MLVDRYGGRRKIRVREGPDRYRDQVLSSFPRVVNRGPTDGTKAKPELRSFVPHSNVLAAPAGDFESGACETRLLGKYTARSSLAGEAVAYGDSNGFSLHFHLKLTAGACGSARDRHLSRPLAQICVSRALAGNGVRALIAEAMHVDTLPELLARSHQHRPQG